MRGKPLNRSFDYSGPTLPVSLENDITDIIFKTINQKDHLAYAFNRKNNCLEVLFIFIPIDKLKKTKNNEQYLYTLFQINITIYTRL